MPEHHSGNAAENLVSGIMDTIAENLPSGNNRFDGGDGSVSEQAQRLFGNRGAGGGGKRNLHRVLGGGKPADVLLWRNKKISSSVLAAATAVWVFFEWLGYHFLTILCFVLVLGMALQFAWATVRSFERASRGAAGGGVRERRRGRGRPGEQGVEGRAGRVVREEPQAVSPGDRWVIRGRRHWELVQFPHRHLHRVRVRAHPAGAVRKVPGPGGRLPLQRPRPAAEPVSEARHGRAQRERQVQEDPVSELHHSSAAPLRGDSHCRVWLSLHSPVVAGDAFFPAV